MVRNYVKNPKIEYDDREIQHDLPCVNNDASMQVQLGLSIVEICVYRSTF